MVRRIQKVEQEVGADITIEQLKGRWIEIGNERDKIVLLGMNGMK